jgi:class 3 adenylate cyclase
MILSGTSPKQIQSRILKTLENGLQFDLSTQHCNKFVRRHVNEKVKLVILYIDICNSTKMSLLLSTASFALTVKVFSQEISLAVRGYGGYILKYVGDAVIAVFPSDFDTYKACEAAIRCATNISFIIKQCINPAFKIHGLPEITVKMGVDYGDALVVLYGKSLHNAHIDLISSSMGITAKIASFAQPNEIVMGQSIYNIFLSNGKLLKALSIPILKKRIRHVKTDKLENS